jgi:hypothetical protein
MTLCKEMKIRFATSIVSFALLGCDKPTQQMNTDPNSLEIRLPAGTQTLVVSEASYNLKQVDYGYELTFSCETEESSEVEYPPNLEVTVFSEEKPLLASGSAWENQPAYVDSVELGHLTNYYQWTHEGFENFSVRIMDVGEDSMRCLISGSVSLNPDGDDPVNVVVNANFLLDPNLGRGVQ